jgi:hypothetical protein
MIRSIKIILVFLIFFSARVQAQDLYSGEVVVEGQSAAERLKSVPAALIQVLQKHSGQRELPMHPALDSALLSANRIMISFFYNEHERVAPDGTTSKEWRLVARFRPDEVERIVQELGLPRWRADRKPITIWVVVDDGLGRRLMPLEYEYAWNALRDISKARGLPLYWPETDNELVQQVDLQLLWGGFTDELPVEAGRGGDVVIVAARREGPVWNVRWNFGSGEQTLGWRVRDTDLSFALVDGLHSLTDFIANRDAITAAGQGNWLSEISISGFRDAEDYARCLAYLEGLAVVDRVNVREAGRGVIRFSLELNAMPEYLKNEIERDDFLIAGLTENDYNIVHHIPLFEEEESD